MKLKLKTGDTVVVTAGEQKGKEGKIVKILKADNKAIVEGVNIVKKHQKPTAQSPQGGIIEKEAPLHLSNLSLIDPKSGKATRVGIRIEDGKKVRFSKKSNEVI
ncbi:MAG: 50S ribosomal protein L24 [Flavobacteriaceae bacterium]|nr:50S ribosomal protein L24 [Flavobacteriaceae bacterium]